MEEELGGVLQQQQDQAQAAQAGEGEMSLSVPPKTHGEQRCGGPGSAPHSTFPGWPAASSGLSSAVTPEEFS